MTFLTTFVYKGEPSFEHTNTLQQAVELVVQHFSNVPYQVGADSIHITNDVQTEIYLAFDKKPMPTMIEFESIH